MYHASYGGRTLIPPRGRALVYISFLSFLLFPGSVLDLSCHLSEHISEEKGASLTDKLLPDSGRPLWPGVVALTGQLADRQRLLLFVVKSQE